MRNKSTKASQHTGDSYRQAGFTLVELLIVIGIIGILVSGVVFALNPVGQLQKANDAKRKADLGQLQKALEQYYNDNGKYPTNTATYQISGANWGSSWGNYIQTVPKDPSSAKKYVYVTNGTQQAYWLYTSLDSINDPQLCNSGSACTNATANSVGTACGGTCNFGVTSSNTTP